MYLKYNVTLSVFTGIILLLHLNSCNYAKHLPADETLLWQNRIVYKNTKIDKVLREDVNSQIGAAIVQKKVNTAIFGLDLETFDIGFYMPRRRLLNYNLLHKKIEKDSNSFYLKRHIAERPVAYSSEATIKSIKNIKTALNNQGYFYAKVQDSVVQKPNKKTCVYYVVDPGKNYTIKDVEIVCNNKTIIELVNKSKAESYTKPTELLTLSNISNERDRISQLLIANGYFYMRPEGILPIVDTTVAIDKKLLADAFEGAFLSLDTAKNKPATTAKLQFIINDSIGLNPLQTFYYRKIIVHIGDNVYEQKKSGKYTEHIYKNIFFRNDGASLINDEILYRNIFVKSGDLYTLKDAEATLNRLNSFKIFRSVKLEIRPVTDSGSRELDFILELNIANKYSDKIELEGSNISGVYAGGLNVKYSILNNNIFRGANLLNVSAHAGLQTNIEKRKFKFYQYTYGVSANVSFPKFLLVQDIIKVNKNYIPITKIGLGFEVFARPSRFTQQNLTADINYKWQANSRVNYKFTPLFVTYVFTPDKSIDKDFYNNSSLQVKNKLKNITIIGSNASIEYSNKLAIFQKRYSSAQIGVEKAGVIADNVFNLINKTDSAIVRYTRIQGQATHFINSKNTTWANKINANVGIPGKNNLSLPLVKQISAGGGASMRGWQQNELGPGKSYDSAAIAEYINRGDIQLELNSEYRFKMFRLFSTVDFNGALFVDAGNIWRYNAIGTNTLGQFKWNSLASDIAVNGGYGLRLDFSLFIVRLDWGVKMRRPYIAENNGWNTQYKFRSKSWRQENQSLQFALTYPF